MRATLVLWDIDGTILRGGGVGRRSMEAAFREVLEGEGVEATAVDLGGVAFHGNTDPAIIAAGLELLGADAHPERVVAIGDAYLRILTHQVAAYRPFERLPGVLETIDELAAIGAHQGLGTGNLETAAWLKVDAVGLAGRFTYGGFGSDARERAELLRIGRDRGAAQIGVATSQCRVIVIGDTLRDILAARAIGAEVVAVATGGEAHDALAEAGPDWLVASLVELDVARALGTRVARTLGV